MTAKRIPLDELTRDQWLESRQRFINASEVAIVCGEASWGSPAMLFAEKKGLRGPLPDSGVLRRGKWGEASVFEALADCFPTWKVTRARLHVVDEERRMGCTPDGFALAPDRQGYGVVQAKVISRAVFRTKWLEEPGGDLFGAAVPPTAYRLQTLMEMMLNGCQWGVLAVLINSEWDWDFRLFEVERNAVLEDRINYKVDEFFRLYLDKNQMPPFDAERDAELVRALYPQDTGTTIDLRADNRAVVLTEDLLETQAALKRIGDREKALKTELQGKLGENTFGLLPDGRCLSWKHQHRKAYTVKPSDFRVFRILEKTPEIA
jgi:predicted phage-related endonuclease